MEHDLWKGGTLNCLFSDRPLRYKHHRRLFKERDSHTQTRRKAIVKNAIASPRVSAYDISKTEMGA